MFKDFFGDSLLGKDEEDKEPKWRKPVDLTTLNEMQREAVTTTDGALLILAGAGSGKTRVLTYRIAYLIEERHVYPYKIMALTFTNKAAKEMRERTEALVGENARDCTIATFHSLCARILRIDGEALGIDKSFTIYDDTEKKTILAGILERMGIDDKNLDKSIAARIISDAKNHSTNPGEYILFSDAEDGERRKKVYDEYEKAMRIACALDFDDLILMVTRLFLEHKELLEKYQNRYSYIMVDEYQDTNMPQYALLKALAKDSGNICVVGDDDQSIYGWRGADIRNILEFENDFPNTKVIRLEQNYRSTGTILKAANEVIKNNSQRKGKNLWTKAGEGDSIVHYSAYDERDEANYICKEISKAINSGANYREFAVLYRTNAQSRIIESTLINFGIPYRVYGGQRFFDRKEVKDIMAYLRLINNPDDDAAFIRAINIPPRKIGDKTVSTIQTVAANTGISMFTAVTSPAYAAILPAGIHKKVAPFIEIIEKHNDLYAAGDLASELAKSLVDEIGYNLYLMSYDAEYQSRAENVLELIGSIAESEQGADENTDTLSQFLENAALVSDIDGMEESDNVVSLMTLHSAKGLEFYTVFIPGMEEDLFPSTRSREDPSKLEEERRLCYVGITRARKKLHLINASSRRLYNLTKNYEQSRFLSEIPESLLVEKGVPCSDRFRQGYTDGYVNAILAASVKKSSYEPTVSRPSSFAKEKPAAKATTMPVSPNKNVMEFSVNQRVVHATFGAGSVVSVTGTGSGSMVTIKLDSGDTKKFAAAFAPLSKE